MIDPRQNSSGACWCYCLALLVLALVSVLGFPLLHCRDSWWTEISQTSAIEVRAAAPSVLDVLRLSFLGGD